MLTTTLFLCWTLTTQLNVCVWRCWMIRFVSAHHVLSPGTINSIANAEQRGMYYALHAIYVASVVRLSGTLWPLKTHTHEPGPSRTQPTHTRRGKWGNAHYGKRASPPFSIHIHANHIRARTGWQFITRTPFTNRVSAANDFDIDSSATICDSALAWRL